MKSIDELGTVITTDVLVLGAGDIGKISDELIERLKHTRQAPAR